MYCDATDCNGYGNCSVCPKGLTQVFVCSGCGQPIYEGQTYYDVLGEQFCEDCMTLDCRKEASKVDESLFSLPG